MKTYNCQVRIGGNLLHAVPRKKVTKLEVELLRFIHGNDSVIALEEVGNIERSERDEQMRLAREYTPKKVRECFGVSLDNFAQWLDDQLMAEEEAKEAKRIERNIVAKPAATTAAHA